MTTDRIKEIQEKTPYPDSVSVYQALLQVWNECEQSENVQLKAERDARQEGVKSFLDVLEENYQASRNDKIAQFIPKNPQRAVMKTYLDLISIYKTNYAKQSEQGWISSEVAYKVLKARDAFVQRDYDEVWHYLYSIASPNYDKTEPWEDLERIASELPSPPKQ